MPKKDKKSGRRPLTAKQKRFCQEYVIDMNGTQAAIRAEFSEKTAGSIAHELLKKPEIKRYLAELQYTRNRRLSITADRVLQEAARLAYFDIRKLYDKDNRLKDIHSIDDDTAAALASIEVDELYEGRGDDRKVVGLTKKVRTFDKRGSVEMLMKHLGLLVDRHQHTGPNGGPIEHRHEVDQARVKAEEIVEEVLGPPAKPKGKK